MTRKSTIVCLSALVLVGSVDVAKAVRAGVYSGTTADGNFITMTVVAGTPPIVGNTSIAFGAACKKSGGQLASEGWGLYLNQPIVHDAVTISSHNDYYFFSGTADFSTKNEVHGFISARTAVFASYPSGTLPKAAVFCVSPGQPFTLTYQAAVAPTPAVSAAVLQKAPPGKK